MIKITNGLQENPYLQNCDDTVFTTMLREMSYSLKLHDKISYIHGLLRYPQWTDTVDLFQFISIENLQEIQLKKMFFVFDSSTEGFSPIHEFPFFDVLYYNCEKYNVDPSMIIFVSSNLKDEDNIKEYCNTKNKKPINVFSFLSFEKVVRTLLTIGYEERMCQQKFEGKYFSSLSRVNRYYRSIATFLLCHDTISAKALISHAALPKTVHLESWKIYHQLNDFTHKDVKRWAKSLPLIVDKPNFNDNWALDNDYYSIHRQTLFQIVNETLVDNAKNTSLFYSEKTFRPVVCFQPFVIYGQQGSNQHLKEIGYQTYEPWFDLSFDNEPDNVLRYKKLLASVKDACSYLDSLSREKQIEWRFLRKDILEHNFSVMATSEYSKTKLKKFIGTLHVCLD